MPTPESAPEPARSPIRAAELRAAGRKIRTPFTVRLADGRMLTVLRLLRVLPGRRVVGEGRLGDRAVLAKLFVSRGSWRYWRRERAGIEALLAAGIPTPTPVAAAHLAGGGQVLLTTFLTDALPLADALADQSAAATRLPAVARLVGSMHRAGLMQTDLHLGNVLLHADTLLMIDGDGVRRRRRPLGERAATGNLARLLAALPTALRAHTPVMVEAYRSANPDFRASADSIRAAVAHADARRIRDFVDKSLRECSRFRVTRNDTYRTVVLRDASEWLEPALHTALTALAEVCPGSDASLPLDGRPVQVRGFAAPAGIRRAMPWRRAPAARAWHAANRARLLDEDAPEPLALVLTRAGPLTGRGWVVLAAQAPGTINHE
ncbi:MAG: hypothetical protein KF911_11515 [Pseudomonadales bacterium]|nr:hypothetical protein [Pseudomonadales bacterium]